MRIGVLPSSLWTATGVNAAPWRRPSAPDYGTHRSLTPTLTPDACIALPSRSARPAPAGDRGERAAMVLDGDTLRHSATRPESIETLEAGVAIPRIRCAAVRAVVISRVYADPATRGKLKALAGLGVSVAAAVPDRWSPRGLGAEQQTVWGEDGGVRTVPIPVRGSTAPGAAPAWSRTRAAAPDHRLPARADPDRGGALDPGRGDRRRPGPPAGSALRGPHPREPPRRHGALGRFRRARVLGHARGLLAVNELAASWRPGSTPRSRTR